MFFQATVRTTRCGISRLANRHSTITASLCRTFIAPSATRRADLVQEMYLRELKNYKPTPVRASDAEGQVHKFRMPSTPTSPEEADIANELKAYEAQQVELEGQSDSGSSVSSENWFEEEEDDEAVAHGH